MSSLSSASIEDISKQNEKSKYLKQVKTLKHENSNLLQKNNELSNQISSLRRQLDQSLEISHKVDEIYSKNFELTKEIAKLKSEKDDLSRRLHIALQSNQDLTNKLHFQMQSPNRTNGQNNTKSSEADAYQKLKYEGMVNDLKKKLDDTQQECCIYKKDFEQNSEMFNNLLAVCSQYFGKTIDSVSTAVQYFNKACPPCDCENYQIVLKKISKMSKKLKKKQSIIDDLQHNINDIHSGKNKLENEKNAEIIELKNQINDLIDKNKEQSHEIHDLTQKNADLTKEVTVQKTQIKYNIIQDDDKQTNENQQLKTKFVAAQTQLNILYKKNKQIKNKLLVLVFKAKSLDKKNKELVETIKDLESKKAELKAEAQKNNKLYTQSEFKVKDVENSVLRTQDELSIQKKENDKLRDEINGYKETIRKNEREIKDIKIERDRLISDAQQYEGKCDVYEKKLLNAEEHIQTLEKQLKDATNPLDIQEIIPPTALSSPEFPSELQLILGENARNTSINIVVRLQSAFSTIAKFYRNFVEQTEKNLSEEQQKLSLLKSQVNTLLDFLKRLMPEVRINYELLLSDEQTRNFLADGIRNLKEIQRFIPIMEEINNILGVSKIEDAKTSIEELRLIIKKLNSHLQKQKDSKLALSNEFKAKADSLNQTIMSLEDEITKLNQKCKEQDEQNKTIQEKIVKSEQQQKQREEELVKNYEEKIVGLNQTLNEMESKAKDASALENNISRLLKKKSRLEQEIKLRQAQNDKLEKTLKDKIKTEKERYDQMSEVTRKQINELQNKIKELTEQTIKLDSSNQSLINSNNEMVLRIQKLETRNNAIQNEFERDKRSLESQFNAKMAFAETEFRSKIEEKKIQTEIVKKKMVDAITRYFSSYLDGLRVDENNLEAALQVLKKKIDIIISRESYIRNRFQFDPRQTLEDAIAALISSSSQKSKKKYKNL